MHWNILWHYVLFASKAGAYPSEASFICSIQAYALDLTDKHSMLERPAKAKWQLITKICKLGL